MTNERSPKARTPEERAQRRAELRADGEKIAARKAARQARVAPESIGCPGDWTSNNECCGRCAVHRNDHEQSAPCPCCGSRANACRLVVWTSSPGQKFTDAQAEALLADPNVEFLSASGRFRRTTCMPK